jgi:excisionase family DNA binding protein
MSTSSGSPLQRLILRQEAADQLRVSLRKLDQMIALKTLNVVRLGRSVRIMPESLAKLIEQSAG